MDKLNTITSDYFNDVEFKKNKIYKIVRSDIGSLLTKNAFILRFSKPVSQRCIFDHQEKDDNVVAVYANGAIYNKFELNLPINCKIRQDDSVITINHPYFVLKIENDFDGTNALLPNKFEQRYMNIFDNKNLVCFSVPIIIDFKFKIRAILIHKTKYYKWIDKYIDTLLDNISFSTFTRKIQWEVVNTVISCLSKLK